MGHIPTLRMGWLHSVLGPGKLPTGPLPLGKTWALYSTEMHKECAAKWLSHQRAQAPWILPVDSMGFEGGDIVSSTRA